MDVESNKLLQPAETVYSNSNLPRNHVQGIRLVDLTMTVLCKDAGLVIVDQYPF